MLMKNFKLILGVILTLLSIVIFYYGFEIIEDVMRKKSSLYEYLVSPLLLLFLGTYILSSLKSSEE